MLSQAKPRFNHRCSGLTLIFRSFPSRVAIIFAKAEHIGHHRRSIAVDSGQGTRLRFSFEIHSSEIQQAPIIGSVAAVPNMMAEYAALEVNELRVPDFTLGERAPKIPTLDRFITTVAGR